MGSGVYTPVSAPQKLIQLAFFVATDSSGDPTNALTASDQYGEPFPVPKEVASITRSELGIYKITLRQYWFDVAYAAAEPFVPKEQAQATTIGSVDLTTLTLSTLNTLTLITDDDVDAARTTTFTTPTSVEDIAAQINARQVAVGNTTTKAETEVRRDGKKYLNVHSTTIGATSDLLITGTARATLGMGDGAAHAVGQKLGRMTPVGFNPRGNQVDLASRKVRAPQVITFAHQGSDGASLAIVSGGFWVDLKLEVHQ